MLFFKAWHLAERHLFGRCKEQVVERRITRIHHVSFFASVGDKARQNHLCLLWRVGLRRTAITNPQHIHIERKREERHHYWIESNHAFKNTRPGKPGKCVGDDIRSQRARDLGDCRRLQSGDRYRRRLRRCMPYRWQPSQQGSANTARTFQGRKAIRGRHALCPGSP